MTRRYLLTDQTSTPSDLDRFDAIFCVGPKPVQHAPTVHHISPGLTSLTYERDLLVRYLRYRLSSQSSSCPDGLVQASLSDFSNLNIASSRDIARRVRYLLLFLHLRRLTDKFKDSIFDIRLDPSSRYSILRFLIPTNDDTCSVADFRILFAELMRFAVFFLRGLFSLRIVLKIFLAKLLFYNSRSVNDPVIDQNLFILPLHPYETVSEFGDLETYHLNRGESVSHLLLPTFSDFSYIVKSFSINNPSIHILMAQMSFKILVTTCVVYLFKTFYSLGNLVLSTAFFRKRRFSWVIGSSLASYSISPGSVNDIMQYQMYSSFFNLASRATRIYSSFEGRGIELARAQIIASTCHDAKHITLAHSTLSHLYLPHFVFFSLLSVLRPDVQLHICLPRLNISLQRVCCASRFKRLTTFIPSCRYNFSYTKSSVPRLEIADSDKNQLSLLLLLDNNCESSNQVIDSLSIAYPSFSSKVRIFIKKHPRNPLNIKNVSFPYKVLETSLPLSQRIFHIGIATNQTSALLDSVFISFMSVLFHPINTISLAPAIPEHLFANAYTHEDLVRLVNGYTSSYPPLDNEIQRIVDSPYRDLMNI